MCYFNLVSMATTSEFTDTNDTRSVNIFADMRSELDEKFTEFDSLLKEHKKKLQLKIDELELEFNNKHKQIENDKQILTDLHQQTQSKLAQDSLVDLQGRILREIDEKLRILNLECDQQTEMRFTLYWSQDDITGTMNSIDVELTPTKATNQTEPPKKPADPPEDNYLPPNTYPPQDPPVYYDTYSNWGAPYRGDRKENRGHRGGRYRDKYAYDNSY